ncbi:MAG: Site-specific recombinase XerD [Frankiales bacterium]|nr:Site-specific recombinase XerD [Frankiales bacterium]
MASLEKRARTDSCAGALISRGVSVVPVSRWRGHSSREITYRVYAHLREDDETAGRAAVAATLGRIVPDVYPVCTPGAADAENPR